MAFPLHQLSPWAILLSLLYASFVTASTNKNERQFFTPTNQMVFNPVTDLGPVESLVGYNPEYQTEHTQPGSSASFEWTASDTIYLTEDVITTTSFEGSRTTTGIVTTSVQVVAATATADAPGIMAGDITVTFSPDIVSKLQAIAEEVCGQAAKRKRAGPASCSADFARQAGSVGGPLEFDIPLPTVSSADVAAVLSTIGQAFYSENAALGWAVILFAVWAETGSMPTTVSVPPSDISNDPSETTSSVTTSTESPPCPTGSNIPLCQDTSDCGSPNNQTCTTSVKYETCSCAPYALSIVDILSVENLPRQQQVLASFDVAVSQYTESPMAAPSCLFDSSPVYSPESWCACGASETYPTLSLASTVASSDMRSALCAYTTLPSDTIQPTSISGSSLPTGIPGMYGCSGCAYYIAANEGLPEGTPDYCFCGGCPDIPPASAPLLTHGDPPKTDCDYSTQPEPTWQPTPTGSPESTPAPSPTLGPLTCNKHEDSFGSCWNDVHGDKLREMLEYWSVLDQPIDSSYQNLTQVRKLGSGVTYMGNIAWIPGCTTYTEQWPAYPERAPDSKSTDSDYFIDIIYSTYAECRDNDGLGGYRDVGCLRYGFYPNNIPGLFDSPPKPELYWQANGNICG